MTKIFFSCSSLGDGGAERVLSILSHRLVQHYDCVEYITWHNLPVFYNIDQRIKIVNIEKECRSKSLFKKMCWFRQYVKTEKPDLILAFSAPFNMLTISSLLFSNNRIIACERTDPRSFRWGRHFEILRNLLYRKTIGILTQTQVSKEYFKRSLYEKTHIIYNPISMDKEVVGSALKTQKEDIIVTAARLAKEKNHILLIKAFARFKRKHPRYKLKIYGEGQEREQLETFVKLLNLEDSVELPGKTKDLWNKIKSARMFIMTSFVEGMSNSMIEAMCLGLPTISTKVSGATDLIVDNENGILIDINDEDALYKSLCKLAENDDLRIKLGQNGAKLYDKLRVDEISKHWIDYINEKLKKS